MADSGHRSWALCAIVLPLSGFVRRAGSLAAKLRALDQTARAVVARFAKRRPTLRDESPELAPDRVRLSHFRLRGADAAGATSDFVAPRSGITSSAARMPDLNK
jgi:hypothetical protein